MKTLLVFVVAITGWLTSAAQTDTTLTKLKLYKDYYTQGLIDSQEYAALKARLLGIEPQYIIVERPRKQKIIDTVVYYDLSQIQKTLPAGLYMNLDELKSKKPSIKCSDITIKPRNNYDYENGLGGNAMLFSDGDCIKKGKLKLDVWIYSNGVRCYANLDHFKLQAFYNPVITMGRFLAFFTNEPDKTVEMANNWGGSIGSEIAMATNHDYRKLYVIDLNTARLEPVTDEYMRTLLKPHANLLKLYESQANPTTAVWAKYLQLLNDAQ